MQTPPFPLTEQSEYSSPIGILQIGVLEHSLAWIGLPIMDPINSNMTKKRDSLTMKQIKIALDGYFANANYSFDLPLFLHGSPFQKKVWQALQALPSGQVLSYSDLAGKLKSHPRAIGTACRTNRIPIVIPCHRILAKSGIGGYADAQPGKWPQMKLWLLKHEKVAI